MSFVRAEAPELFAGALNWLTDDFAFAWVNDGIGSVVNDETYTRLTDVTTYDELDVAITSGKAVTNGVLSADDPADQTFPTPDVTIVGGWLYHDTGVAATSELLAWYDRTPADLPISFVTPSGLVHVHWPRDVFGQGFITL